MGVIDNLKEIAYLVKRFNDTELNEKVDAFEREIVELTLQIGSLEEENGELKRTLSLIQKMRFKKPFYYQEDDPVPFCPCCWEREKKPVHLYGPVKVAAGLRYGCPRCKEFFVEEGREQGPEI